MKEKKEKSRDPSSYYKLHTSAVDNLVNAEKDTPKYAKEELEKYTRRGKFHLSYNIKVLLMKWWGYGAVCFFTFWGLGMYVPDQLDMLFVSSMIMGMGTNLILNHFIRGMEKTKNQSRKWIMVQVPGVPGMILDVLYAMLLMMMVTVIYYMINTVLHSFSDSMLLGVEPVLFGLFYLGCDRLCLLIKHTLIQIVSDARRKSI